MPMESDSVGFFYNFNASLDLIVVVLAGKE